MKGWYTGTLCDNIAMFGITVLKHHTKIRWKLIINEILNNSISYNLRILSMNKVLMISMIFERYVDIQRSKYL